MGYSNGQIQSDSTDKGEKGDPGLPGIGFNLTDDGNFDSDGKRLTDVADGTDDKDAVNYRHLKNLVNIGKNNYHLQQSFTFSRKLW